MTAPQKPRTWTIYDGCQDCIRLAGPDIAYAETVNVIEHSAYDEIVEAFKKVFIQWDGLGKYKDDDFGEVASVMEDAREALARHGIKI